MSLEVRLRLKGPARKVYNLWLLGKLGGHRPLAAAATLVLALVLVIVPLLTVLGAGANEALRMTETVRPRLQLLVDQPGEFDSRLRDLPGYTYFGPYRAQVLAKAGELSYGVIPQLEKQLEAAETYHRLEAEAEAKAKDAVPSKNIVI